MSKLKLWQKEWEEAEAEWETQRQCAAKKRPIQSLKVLPKMAGITAETAKYLKWKSLWWIITKDHQGEIKRGIKKRPFFYLKELVHSLLKKQSFEREGDFFFYGVSNLKEFEQQLQNPAAILVLGFSYCHKPFECPSGRFNDQCQNAPDHFACQQCFIGKSLQASKAGNVIPLLIPTVHYIGGKIFDVVHRYPDRPILIIITACEMTLKMFGDLGNMVKIKGIGVRLDGRICNTMQAFALSERGIKPGLTVVLPETQKKILQLIRQRVEVVSKSC